MAYLEDLSAPKRKEVVAMALEFALADLQGPAPTWEVVKTICARLHTNEQKLVARVVADMAPAHPKARKGGEFKRYGRIMTRWQWGDAPKVGAETTEWEIVTPAADPADQRDAAGQLTPAARALRVARDLEEV